LGAELCSLKKGQNKQFIWQANPAFWGKHAPILFPIVGTLKNNSYHIDNNEYHLSRHGFARDLEFSVIKKTENSVHFSLMSSEETLKTYPFEFELQISYTLEKNSLIVAYKVINKNEAIMPFSIGAHPAFALDKPFENYSLAFEHEEVLTSFQLENDLLSNTTTTIEMTKNQVPLHYSLFEKDALIFKNISSKTITILENQKPMLAVEFNDFPDLGIWTKSKAPFLCIEPWFGYSDTLHTSGNLIEKEGIQLLDPQGVFDCNYQIKIL
jgi:galactose mutarotase-like enzyme